MRGTPLRRSLSKHAALNELGAVRRVHRSRRDWPEPIELLPWFLGFCMAVAVAGAFNWRFAVLLPVLVWVVMACWIYLVPPLGPDTIRRIAVCDGGLLVLSRGSAAPIAITWDALTTPQRGAKGLLVGLSWTTTTETRTVYIDNMTARRELGKAVDRHEPVRAELRRPSAFAAAGLAVLALVTWMLQPWLVPAILGERPENLRELARLCWRQDRPYERTAPYEGAGPHSLVLFREGAGLPQLATTGEGKKQPAPDQVQLVACSYPMGRVSNKPIKVCLYQRGVRTETFQGRHRLDIYEASTGRRVSRQLLNGRDSVAKCPPVQFVYGPKDPKVRQGDTFPSLNDYEAALQNYITRPAT
jgi:hypothetical protein